MPTFVLAHPHSRISSRFSECGSARICTYAGLCESVSSETLEDICSLHLCRLAAWLIYVVRLVANISSRDEDTATAAAVSLAAYLMMRGKYSTSELITFSATDANSYTATDATGSHVIVEDTGAVIFNQRVLVIDGYLVPVSEGKDLPLLLPQIFIKLILPLRLLLRLLPWTLQHLQLQSRLADMTSFHYSYKF